MTKQIITELSMCSWTNTYLSNVQNLYYLDFICCIDSVILWLSSTLSIKQNRRLFTSCLFNSVMSFEQPLSSFSFPGCLQANAPKHQRTMLGALGTSWFFYAMDCRELKPFGHSTTLWNYKATKCDGYALAWSIKNRTWYCPAVKLRA